MLILVGIGSPLPTSQWPQSEIPLSLADTTPPAAPRPGASDFFG